MVREMEMRAQAAVKNEIRVLDEFPRLIVEFSGAPNDAEFASYIAKVEAAAERGAARNLSFTRTVILFDTTEATRPVTPAQRRMQADHMVRMRAKARANGAQEALVGVCFVLCNPLLRGVMTAVLWLHPVSHRYEVCSTRDEADEWCRKWLLTPAGDPARPVRG